MTIHLHTLGGLRASDSQDELDWLPAQRMRVGLLVYLAVERRVSRSVLAAVLWPESGEPAARRALRQGIYHLRKTLGRDCIEGHAHELRIGEVVHTDVHAFDTALDRGQPDAAARLYQGPFLDGVFLADLEPWERWVDGRRAEYARAFRRACREWLDDSRARGDLDEALEAAQCWVRPDPLDDEAQHRLIETLAEAGERAEAIRQYEAYARLLDADGLRPLDETAAVVEELRRNGVPWPGQATAVGGKTVSREAPPTPPGRGDSARGPGSGSPGRAARSSRPAVPVRLGAAAALLGLAGAVLLVPDRLPTPPTPLPNPAAGHHPTAIAERIVLAGFEGPAEDPALGAVVSDALRYDLQASPHLTTLEPEEVRQALETMRVPDAGGAVPARLAREVALRTGAKAVLEGKIVRVGAGYRLTAVLRSAESGRVLVSVRETALTQDGVIPAIDRLSQRIRREAGEPLRAVGATPELERVTTASLDALRAYSRAERAFQVRDYRRAIPVLESAVELDPEFAMAWRLLAVALGNSGLDAARESEAAAQAYRFRGRLGPRERYLAEAAYHSRVTGAAHATVEAYRKVLDVEPDDPVALNNLALIHRDRGDPDLAAELFRKASRAHGSSPIVAANLVHALLTAGRLREAGEAAEALARSHPDHAATADARFWVALESGDERRARAAFQTILRAPDRPPSDRALAYDRLARLALWGGRIDEARGHLRAAEEVARRADELDAFAWRLSRAHAEAAVGDAARGAQLLARAADEGPGEEAPRPAPHYLVQAVVLALAGHRSELERMLRTLDTDPSFTARHHAQPRERVVRALLLLLQNRPAEAVRLLEHTRQELACERCGATWMGWALRDAGLLDEAAREWEAALSGVVDLDDPGLRLAQQLWIMQRLPALYEELGDTLGAVRHYRRIVDQWAGAEGHLQLRVAHARARLAALDDGRGTSPRLVSRE